MHLVLGHMHQFGQSVRSFDDVICLSLPHVLTNHFFHRQTIYSLVRQLTCNKKDLLYGGQSFTISVRICELNQNVCSLIIKTNKSVTPVGFEPTPTFVDGNLSATS